MFKTISAFHLDSCPITPIFQPVINHCEGEFSLAYEEQDDYGTGWKELQNTTSTSRKRRSTWIVKNQGDPKILRRQRREITAGYQTMSTGRGSSLRRRKQMNKKQTSSNGQMVYYVSPEALMPDGTVISCSDRWEYFTAAELRGFPIPGRITTYPGGGYSANLGYNEETSWTVLADLHQHNWLDKQTRGVFAEFTIYNGNLNLFLTAFLYLETLPTGSAFPWADFKVFNGYRYSAADGLGSLWAELVFICFIVYFGVREIRKMIKQKLNYFKSFFNVIEALLMPLYLVMFVLIIVRWLTTSANIKTFKENPKDFVSFQYSAASDAALMSVIGIVSFLLNIKLLKLLQFNKLFFVTGQVIKAFLQPLMNFMVSFVIYFLLFCWCAHLGFGAQNENYQTIVRSITTQFLHLLGATDFDGVRDASPFFGPVYYLGYGIFMVFVAFNMFMAIICEAIDADYDEEFEKQAGDIQLAEYFTKKLQQIIGKDIDDTLRVDGEDEDVEEKYNKTKQQMDDFESCLERLHETINHMHIDVTIDEDMASKLVSALSYRENESEQQVADTQKANKTNDEEKDSNESDKGFDSDSSDVSDILYV